MLDRGWGRLYGAARFRRISARKRGFFPEMATEPPPPNLDDIEQRLKKARPHPVEERTDIVARPQAMGMAFRVSVELVSALAVSVGIGWLIDRWLGTGPWAMV